MQRAETSSPSFPTSTLVMPHSGGVFNVVLVYEDLETGKNARRVYDFLAENLGQDCQCRLQMWKFDVLSIPKLCEMAAQDAAEADLLIVSTHGSQPLAEPAVVWIESWLALGTRALALVALVDSQEGWREDSSAFLRQVAQRANIEYFAHPDTWPGSILPSIAVGSLRPPVEAASQLSARAPIPHWGINE